MDLPNYLHIGFSKAASTYLQDILKNDPDIYFVYKTYYFTPLESEVYKKGIDGYKKFFNGSDNYEVVIESQEHIILPIIHPELKMACINMDAVDQVLIRIKETIPDVKLILVLRNQVDMIISRYTQYVNQGGKLGSSDFLNKVLFHNNYLLYLDYRYYEIIRIIYRHIRQENLLILFQEELIFDKNIFINKLSKFFQHDLLIENINKMKRNIGLSYYGIIVLRFINKLFVLRIETINSRTKTWIGFYGWYALVKLFKYIDYHLVQTKNKNKIFSEEDVKSIQQVFLKDNQKLEKMLSFPADKYGYKTKRVGK